MASYHRQNSHIDKKKVTVSFVIREREERYHRAGVNSLQYDSRLDRLYSAGRDSVVRIWSFNESWSGTNVNGCNPSVSNSSHHAGDSREDFYLQSMGHHTDWVNDIVLCCDGRNMISVSNDTTIKVWNAHQGFCLSTLRSHKDYAKCLAYAKDREIIASAGFDKMIYLWDIQALTMLTATKNTVTTKPLDGSKSSIYSLAITQTGNLVASGSTEKVIRLWDPRARQKLLKLRGHTDNVKSLIFSPDGSMLISASSDSTMRLWSISEQRCISILRPHDEGVWTLQTGDNFNYVYSAGKDGRIFRTDLKNPSHSSLIAQETSPVLKILLVDRCYSKNGLVGHNDQSLWVATTDSKLKNWSAKATNFEDLSLDRGPRYEDSNRSTSSTPNLIIPGNSAVISYQILNDKRHILTHESDNSVAVYDVLTARKIETIYEANDDPNSREIFDKEVKQRNKMIYVPNWFSVDLKIGLLYIHLEENECLSAWVSARDYGFVPCVEGQDPKVNLGCLMLQALFDYWPPTFETYEGELKGLPQDEQLGGMVYLQNPNNTFNGVKNHSERVHCGSLSQRIGNQYFSIASHTPIIISEGNQTMMRFLASEACNENEEMFIEELIPPWISDIIIAKCQPKLTKIPFFLLPHANSGIKSLRKERLSASDMLQIRKVVEHVCEKIIVNIVNENGSPMINQESCNPRGSGETSIMSAQKVELYCNDQRLDENLDLRTVKHFIWKSGGDLVLHYMPLK